MPITKNDLINDTAISCGAQRETARIVIEQFFSVVKDSLKKGNSLEIRGFGTFSSKNRNSRAGRNLQTGELIPLAAYKNVSFKYSSELKAKIAGSVPKPKDIKEAAPATAKEQAQARELAETNSP
jgi:integration host factor subunit alpha